MITLGAWTGEEGAIGMVVTVSRGDPAVAPNDERPGLAVAETLVRERTGRIVLADDDGHRVQLPETAVQLVHQVLPAFARGNPVKVTALPTELTVRRAAKMLDVPVTEIIRLLDDGAIPAAVSGEFRRIRGEDLIAYKGRRDAARREALDELSRLGQEMGGYDISGESRELDVRAG